MDEAEDRPVTAPPAAGHGLAKAPWGQGEQVAGLSHPHSLAHLPQLPLAARFCFTFKKFFNCMTCKNTFNYLKFTRLKGTP